MYVIPMDLCPGTSWCPGVLEELLSVPLPTELDVAFSILHFIQNDSLWFRTWTDQSLICYVRAFWAANAGLAQNGVFCAGFDLV